MTNLVQISEPQAARINLTSVEPFPIGLSYSPYLTENKDKRLYIKRFVTGEIVISTHDVYVPDLEESTSKPQPPRQSGERVVNGLSSRGKTRLRRAANLYNMIQEESRGTSPHMITLTYGDTSKSGHVEAKQDLDRFLKSYTRYVKTKYNKTEVHWVWVAEIQPKRLKRTGEAVIHFHIMGIDFVPQNLVNKWWNNAVNKPRAKAGLPTQKLLPNIISCFHAGAYMAKYLSKEGHRIKGNGYNMSQATSSALKPSFEECVDVPLEAVAMYYDALSNTSSTHTSYLHIDRENDIERMLWVYDTKEADFKEVIKHIRHEQASRQEQHGQSTSSALN